MGQKLVTVYMCMWHVCMAIWGVVSVIGEGVGWAVHLQNELKGVLQMSLILYTNSPTSQYSTIAG